MSMIVIIIPLTVDWVKSFVGALIARLQPSVPSIGEKARNFLLPPYS